MTGRTTLRAAAIAALIAFLCALVMGFGMHPSHPRRKLWPQN
jgi:ABC-type Fe3+ transport system permease subunit